MMGGGSPLMGGKGGPPGGGARGPFGAGPPSGKGGYQPVDNQGMGPPSATQQQGNPPSSAAESYGLRGTLKSGTTTPMNIVFFLASCCVIIGAFVGGAQLLWDGSFVDYLNLTYIMFFGIALALLDTPFFKTNRLCLELKACIIKYASLVTRITGKGFCLVFLGCANLSAMFANLNSVGDKLLAFFLSFTTIFIGVLAIGIGAMKTKRLRRMQHILAGGVFETLYGKYAIQYPEASYSGEKGGLTMAEFNRLATENTPIKWDDADLKLIFNALVSNPAWRASGGGDAPQKISKLDLTTWVKGPLVFL